MNATSRPAAASPALRHKLHKGRREVPGVDPRVDTLLGMVMALTSEVSVLRERLDAHERLGAASQPVTPEMVDHYVPDETVAKARAAMRQRLIDKVCRPMRAADSTEPGKDNGDDEE